MTPMPGIIFFDPREVVINAFHFKMVLTFRVKKRVFV